MNDTLLMAKLPLPLVTDEASIQVYAWMLLAARLSTRVISGVQQGLEVHREKLLEVTRDGRRKLLDQLEAKMPFARADDPERGPHPMASTRFKITYDESVWLPGADGKRIEFNVGSRRGAGGGVSMHMIVDTAKGTLDQAVELYHLNFGTRTGPFDLFTVDWRHHGTGLLL